MPFGSIVVVVLIWTCISVPLCLFGTVIGRNWNGTPDNPCRVKRIPSPIPEKKVHPQPILEDPVSCQRAVLRPSVPTDFLPHDNARLSILWHTCQALWIVRHSFRLVCDLLLSQRSSLQPLSCVITVSMPGHTQFYLKPWVICLMGGLLPFGSIFIEMYFIFTSFWNYKVRSCAWQARVKWPRKRRKIRASPPVTTTSQQWRIAIIDSRAS